MAGPFLFPGEPFARKPATYVSGSSLQPSLCVMNRFRALTVGVLIALPSAASAQNIAQQYAPAADRIIAAALRDSAAYKRLGELVDKFGHRLSGSQQLEQA